MAEGATGDPVRMKYITKELVNAVLKANPNVLIVVMAMCFGADLRPMKSKPVELILPNKVSSCNYPAFNSRNVNTRPKE